jgi:hypothetical protein
MDKRYRGVPRSVNWKTVENGTQKINAEDKKSESGCDRKRLKEFLETG